MYKISFNLIKNVPTVGNPNLTPFDKIGIAACTIKNILNSLILSIYVS